MPFSQMKMGLGVLLALLLAASLDRATCSSTIIKVPPIKPGEMNQTIVVNIPPTVDVTRTVQTGNNTSEQLVLQPQPLPSPPGGDCLLSDCDENDVGCDGLPPCGPFCPQEACSRVNCSQCWQAGFGGPCCWSCCSQYMPYTFPQQPLTAPQQRQQPPFFPFPQPEAGPLPQPFPIPQLRPIPIPQPQPIPIAQSQPIPIPQQQAVPQPQPFLIAQPQPIPLPQPQPIPIPQPQPIPVSQPQPIPIPQPRPFPFPISVPQPYAVPQPIPYPQLQPQLQPQQIPQTQASYLMTPSCRQVPRWPFVECYPTPNCGPWYNPVCGTQGNWPRPCYQVYPC